MTKKKAPKVPDTPKKKEQPNKQKPKGKKRTPTRTYKSFKTAAKNVKVKALTGTLKAIQEQVKRNEERQAAIQTAAAFVRTEGYAYDIGNYLIIVNRAKLMLAFDIPEPIIPGLQKNADITKHRLVFIEPVNFKSADLRKVITNALNLQKEQEVKPKKTRRLKKLSKPLDRNLGLS